MSVPPTETLTIGHPSDAAATQRAAQDMALALAFDAQSSAEIALVARELATNLLAHAGGGEIVLTPIENETRRGLRIESRDRGPGIADVERAMTDGFSTSGSLGYGLGTVNRLMDQVRIASQPGRQTSIVCERWIRDEPPLDPTCVLDVGVASRPHPGMTVNGDAFVVKTWRDQVLTALIDGLGHGQHAHRAAEKARQYIESHFDQPLAEIFRGVGHSCRGTRGVVMALARFDCTRRRLTFASIGNIETRPDGPAAHLKLMVRRGIVGVKSPDLRVVDEDWPRGSRLVLHTDGIGTHWDWKDFAPFSGLPARALARELLVRLAKDHDDATVLVVRDSAP
jgi:anti-sigma regulatory factor (Ser/Thr protein kinase)